MNKQPELTGTIKTFKTEDGNYIVSENDVWIDAMFASEQAAVLSVFFDEYDLSVLMGVPRQPITYEQLLKEWGIEL